MGEVEGETITSVKIRAVNGGVLTFPEGTPEAIEVYNVGDKMSKIEAYAKAKSSLTKGNVKEAAIEGVKEAVGICLETK